MCHLCILYIVYLNHGKMVPGKRVPRKNGRREKWSPRKTVPGELRNEKSWGGRRASWCVCGMLGCDQSMKTQNSTTNPQLGNEPKTRKQNIVGWASSIVVSVSNVWMWLIYENPKLDNKPTTRQQTQNTETKNRGVSVEHRGVCVECSDVINLWKPKTRQQIFLNSFSVLHFGAYVGSWRKRQTSFSVCSGINW